MTFKHKVLRSQLRQSICNPLNVQDGPFSASSHLLQCILGSDRTPPDWIFETLRKRKRVAGEVWELKACTQTSNKFSSASDWGKLRLSQGRTLSKTSSRVKKSTLTQTVIVIVYLMHKCLFEILPHLTSHLTFMLFVVMIYIIKNALENELNRNKITIFSTV